MAQTYGSPVFVGLLNVKSNTPLIHKAPTYEIEEPFRICEKPQSRIIRIARNKAIVIGLWRKNNTDESDVLLKATQGYWTEYGTPDDRDKDQESADQGDDL